MSFEEDAWTLESLVPAAPLWAVAYEQSTLLSSHRTSSPAYMDGFLLVVGRLAVVVQPMIRNQIFLDSSRYRPRLNIFPLVQPGGIIL